MKRAPLRLARAGRAATLALLLLGSAQSSFGGGGEISFLMEFEDAVETPEKDSDAACET